MSEIIIPSSNDDDEEELKYKPTDDDEERFFLIYHLNIQPSEAEALNPDYRKWLIARFIAQKNAERHAIESHAMMRQLGGNLKA